MKLKFSIVVNLKMLIKHAIENLLNTLRFTTVNIYINEHKELKIKGNT